MDLTALRNFELGEQPRVFVHILDRRMRFVETAVADIYARGCVFSPAFCYPLFLSLTASTLAKYYCYGLYRATFLRQYAHQYCMQHTGIMFTPTRTEMLVGIS